jgi:hypothetical protein
LVVRYDYNWARRASRFENADKDHPACIVATYRKKDCTEDRVLYLPISHTPRTGDEKGIEIPDVAKWVLVSQCNLDSWPFDIHQIPRQPGRFHYRHLPPKFFDIIKVRFAQLYRERKTQIVPRHTP